MEYKEGYWFVRLGFKTKRFKHLGMLSSTHPVYPWVADAAAVARLQLLQKPWTRARRGGAAKWLEYFKPHGFPTRIVHVSQLAYMHFLMHALVMSYFQPTIIIRVSQLEYMFFEWNIGLFRSCNALFPNHTISIWTSEWETNRLSVSVVLADLLAQVARRRHFSVLISAAMSATSACQLGELIN